MYVALKRFLFAVLFSACLWSLQARAGYTHYFTWNATPSEAELKKCMADMRLVIEARKKMLAGPQSPFPIPGQPEIGVTNVDFNGIGDDGHEPFVFPGEPGFNFCKTAYKPYDEVVTACLLVARDHFPPKVLAISSDGEWADWGKGEKLYRSVFGRSPKYPFGEAPSEVNSSEVVRNIGISLVLIGALVGVARWRRWV